MSSYQGVVAAGPSQQGFSQSELNAMNSSAITNNANQFKNVAGAVKSGQAAQGGGNQVSEAGATTNANLGVAEASAANTANSLNQITQANYAAGRQNYQYAAGQEQGLTGAFNNASGMENSAQGGVAAVDPVRLSVNGVVPTPPAGLMVAVPAVGVPLHIFADVPV